MLGRVVMWGAASARGVSLLLAWRAWTGAVLCWRGDAMLADAATVSGQRERLLHGALQGRQEQVQEATALRQRAEDAAAEAEAAVLRAREELGEQEAAAARAVLRTREESAQKLEALREELGREKDRAAAAAAAAAAEAREEL